MSLTILRGSWEMAQDLWGMRWEAMREEGPVEMEAGLIARLQWETHGYLVDDKFLALMAYDGTEPVGFMVVTQQDVAGAHAQQGFYVVGFYVRPQFRRGTAATRLALALMRVVRDMKVPRMQSVVASRSAAELFERHGFKEIGRVYEWRGQGCVEPVNRPENGQEVHGQGG